MLAFTLIALVLFAAGASTLVSASVGVVSLCAGGLQPWSRFAVCGRANQIDVYDVITGEHVQRLTDPALAAVKSGVG